MTVRDIIAKYQGCSGGKLIFSDPYGNHIPIVFDAFITEMNQTFSLSYDSEEVYGRNDPIMSYRNTKRTISLAWMLPANDLYEAKLNRLKTRLLIRMLYPRYENTKSREIEKSNFDLSSAKQNSIYGRANDRTIVNDPAAKSSFNEYFQLKTDLTDINDTAKNSFFTDKNKYFQTTRAGYHHTQTMVENPIIGIKYANLISNGDQEPLMGYLDGLSPQPVLDQGYYTECLGEVTNPITKQKEKVAPGQYPKVYQLSCNFNVIHEDPLGFGDGGKRMSEIFSY